MHASLSADAVEGLQNKYKFPGAFVFFYLFDLYLFCEEFPNSIYARKSSADSCYVLRLYGAPALNEPDHRERRV